MKSRNYFRLLFIVLVAFMASCTDENDDAPGNNPPVDDRSDFVGTWTCAENAGQPSAQTFSISISLRGSEDSISISNFSNYGTSAVAYGLISGNSLTIPTQDIGITQITVSGTGVLNSAGNKITMNYTADGETISAIATKN